MSLIAGILYPDYHVPADWLHQSTNVIIILEEQSASSAKVQLQVRT
jgi:hypothetical protein